MQQIILNWELFNENIFNTIFIEDVSIEKTLPESPKKDKQLEDLLKAYNIFSLYDTFERNRITSEVVWDLDADIIKEMGLSVGERLLYSKAKKTRTAEDEGKEYLFIT